jgi:hypothetical protein
MFAFEPTTMALGLALAEKAISRPARACCCVRRASDMLLDCALNEAAEPFLDSLGTALFHQAIESFIVSLGLSILFLAVNSRLNQ